MFIVSISMILLDHCFMLAVDEDPSCSMSSLTLRTINQVDFVLSYFGGTTWMPSLGFDFHFSYD